MNSTSSLPSPVLRTAALCGVIAGALCILWVLFLYFTDNNPYGPKRTLSDFFPPLAAVGSQLLLRRHYAHGPGLWKSIGTGVLTVVISAALAGTGLYTFSRLTGQPLIEQHLAEARQILENTKALYLKEPNGRQQYEASLRNLAHTAPDFAEDEFAKKLLLGVLLSIPAGVFLRK